MKRLRDRSRTRSPSLRLQAYEQLESRHLCAVLADARTIRYTDIDGDAATIKFSKPVLTGNNVPLICSFNSGGNFSFEGPQQLNLLDLSLVAAIDGNVKVTATRKGAGDGLVAVGAVVSRSAGVANRLTIKGDLGQLLFVGPFDGFTLDANTIRVDSLGRFGTQTQAGNDVLGYAPANTFQTATGYGSLIVKGDVTGMEFEGFEQSFLTKEIRIGGSVIDSTLDVTAQTPFKLTINGDILRSSITTDDLTTAFVGGSIIGGDTDGSGNLNVFDFKSITIRGDIVGGTGDRSGALEVGSGDVIHIGGSIIGGSVANALSALERSGCVIGVRVDKITVDGSLVAAERDSLPFLSFVGNGSISASAVGTLTIKGDIEGHESNPASISIEDGPEAFLGQLRVNGNVERASIRVQGANPSGADIARIGSVTVKGSWSASSIAAGAESTNDFFGDDDDAQLENDISTIGRVTIKGTAFGSVEPGDFFGIVAQEVVAVKVGSKKVPLVSGAANDNVFIGLNNDFKVRELVS